MKIKRIMDPDEQLRLWVEGESIHNGPDSIEGECCPDFSCCNPEMLLPRPEREAYMKQRLRHIEGDSVLALSTLTRDNGDL